MRNVFDFQMKSILLKKQKISCIVKTTKTGKKRHKEVAMAEGDWYADSVKKGGKEEAPQSRRSIGTHR